jgi:hypothetical protein
MGARFQPSAVVFATDPNSLIRPPRDDGSAWCVENAAPGAFADAVQGAPFLEGENAIIIGDKPRPQRR